MHSATKRNEGNHQLASSQRTWEPRVKNDLKSTINLVGE